MLRTTVLAASLAVFSASPELPGAPLPQEGDHFPTPSGALQITNDLEGRLTLEGLLQQFSALTGQQIHTSAETRQVLAQTPVGLLGSVEVPATEVYSFVENLLFQSHFVISELRHAAPRLLAVHSLDTRDSQWISGWVEVPAERLPIYADHPALLVQSVIATPGIDARQLANSLRPLMRNNAYQSLINMGTSDSILVRATGSEVAELASMVEQAVQDAEEARARAPQEEPQDG